MWKIMEVKLTDLKLIIKNITVNIIKIINNNNYYYILILSLFY